MLAGLNRAFDAFCLLLSEGGQVNGEENDFGFRPAFKTRFSSLTSAWVTLGYCLGYYCCTSNGPKLVAYKYTHS